MQVNVYGSAYRHGITDDEIRATIAYPLIRYAITTEFEDADTYMFVGRIDNEPWIEVAAEDRDGDSWEVFHSMLLTQRVATEVYVASAGAIDLCAEWVGQRPTVGTYLDLEEGDQR
ncbi:hypothetical protein [Gordonia sp. NPDC003422]